MIATKRTLRMTTAGALACLLLGASLSRIPTLAWADAPPLADEAISDAAEQPRPGYNGVVQISERLINNLLERPIRQQQTVRNTVAGATTVADTTTEANLRVDFVPNRDRAVVDFRLMGALSAPNATASKRSVTVRMTSQTTIDARKRVVVTPEGLLPMPSEADCNTDTQIVDVEANRKVMEWIGRRRAEKMRPEAQQSASQQVAEQVETELDNQAKDQLAEANRFYTQNLRLPLLNIGGFPRDMRLSTSENHFHIRVMSWKPGQQVPPRIGPDMAPRHDVTVYGHESIVPNMTEPLIGGKVFSDKQFLELVRILTGRASRGLWVFDGRARWTVTFAKREPASVKFADGTFRLTFKFESATCGDLTVHAPMETSALYRPEITSDGPRLVRESVIVFRYTDGGDDTPDRVALRQELTQRFDAFFKPDVYFDGLAPPAGGTYAKLRTLKPTELRCEDGWFVIGYDLDEPAKVAAQP